MFKAFKITLVTFVSMAASANAECFDYGSLRYGRENVESLPASMCAGVIKYEVDRLGLSDQEYSNIGTVGRIAGAVEDVYCPDRIRPYHSGVDIYLDPGQDYYRQQISGFNYANSVRQFEGIEQYSQLLANCNVVLMHYITIFQNTRD